MHQLCVGRGGCKAADDSGERGCDALDGLLDWFGLCLQFRSFGSQSLMFFNEVLHSVHHRVELYEQGEPDVVHCSEDGAYETREGEQSNGLGARGR